MTVDAVLLVAIVCGFVGARRTMGKSARDSRWWKVGRESGRREGWREDGEVRGEDRKRREERKVREG